MKIPIHKLAWPALIAIFAALGAVIAQQSRQDPGDRRLDNAIALLGNGQPQRAKEILSVIETNDPAYPAAQAYTALAHYALGDKKGFWKALYSADVREALAHLDIREDVCFKKLDAFLSYGKFDSLVRTIAEFETSFPASSRLPAVQEYRLAGLIDRGLKKSRDAARGKAETERDQDRTLALTNLQEFLTRAASRNGADYTALSGRSLEEDVWMARLLVGEGDQALAEIPAQDKARREKFHLLRLELEADLQRDEIDKNLERLAEFQKAFPVPNNVARASRTAAVLNFRKGRQLSLQAEDAESSGNVQTAASLRSQAAQHFGIQRSLQQNATADAPVGLTADDVLEIREDFLYSYFLEKNYTQLSSLIDSTLASAEPGGLNWILAKVYRGISLASQSPQSADAAAAFDEVLALDFQEEHHHDRLLVAAAKWRFYLLIQAGDLDKARDLVRRVLNSQCRRDYRVAFSDEHGRILSQP